MSGILTIIFGAGASFDCRPEYQHAQGLPRLPLTDSLFLTSPRDASEFGEQKRNILGHYERASALGYNFHRQQPSGTKSLEEFLKDPIHRKRPNLLRNVREVPFFLRELIGQQSLSIKSRFGQTDYSVLLYHLEKSRYEKIILITLNYDLLLDWALENVAQMRLVDLESYVGHQERWYYLKYHGSVSWVRYINKSKVGDKKIGTDLDQLCSLDPDSSPVVDNRIRIQYSKDYSYGSGGNTFFYPVMVLPHANEKKHICPDNHIEQVLPFMHKCEEFWIIGNSMRDLDITAFVKGEAKAAKKVKIVDEIRDKVPQEILTDRVLKCFPKAEIKPEFDGFHRFIETLKVG